MATVIFQRYEEKYLLTTSEYEFLLPLLLKHTSYDAYCPNGKPYAVNSLYYDTRNQSVARRSLSKPPYKEKLRLRSYEALSSPSSVAFLELKKKYAKVVYKRRISLTVQEAKKFITEQIYPEMIPLTAQEIAHEIAYFLQVNPIEKETEISYQRVALSGNEEKELRITFDKEITYYDSEHTPHSLLSDNHILMEIKTPRNFPLWLCSTLSATHIYPNSFSKYGEIIKRSYQRTPATTIPSPLYENRNGAYQYV